MAPTLIPACLFLNNDLFFTPNGLTRLGGDESIQQYPPLRAFVFDFWSIPLVICIAIYTLLCLFGLWLEIRRRDDLAHSQNHGDAADLVRLIRGRWYHRRSGPGPHQGAGLSRILTEGSNTLRCGEKEDQSRLLR